MNKHTRRRSSVFWKALRAVFLLACLGFFAFREAAGSPKVRRTFVFYAIGDDREVVEERMLPRLSSEELSVRRYVEETLLGPASPRTAPLFPRETRLRSLLYRDGVVYADLSERAALPPLEDRPPREGEVFRSLRALDRGIRRNFPQVKDVRLFINGHPAAGGARGVISAGDDDCRDRPPVPGLAPRFTKRAEKYAVMPPSSASNSTCSRARVVSSSLSMSLPETGVRLWRSLPFPTAS